MEKVYEYIISSIQKVGESKIFKLFPKEERVEFKPGQFVKISKPDRSIGRAYSIASPPSWEFLEFFIRITGGEFTSYLDTLKVGDELIISRAAGHMTYGNEKEVVFIGGGVGISPIIGIIRHIVSNNLEGDFSVFYSSRNLDNMAYYDELLMLEKMHKIKFIPILTRERIEGFENEHISIEMIKRYEGKLRGKSFFMCGNIKMVNELRKSLLEEGVEKEKIKTEGWG